MLGVSSKAALVQPMIINYQDYQMSFQHSLDILLYCQTCAFAHMMKN